MTSRPREALVRGGLIVAVGSVDPSHLDYLQLVVGESVGLPLSVHDRPMSADAAYDPVRRQWNAGALLAELEAQSDGREAGLVLGVTEVDLYIPILTFVFGLAYFGGRSALISVHRLHPEFYGLPGAPDLVLRRLEKEALHEIGHTRGLKHCDDYRCVMHYSNTAEEVDLKDARYCELCQEKMRTR